MVKSILLFLFLILAFDKCSKAVEIYDVNEHDEIVLEILDDREEVTHRRIEPNNVDAGRASSSSYRLVCYLTNWSQYRPDAGKFFPKNVDPKLCTHMIYAFAKMTNHKLDKFEWNDETLYQQTIDLKRINPSLKVLLAVGGWNFGSRPFSEMVNNERFRSEFVSDSVQFLQKYKFDGLDLDWEYPSDREGSSPSDKAKFTKLCQELKQAFKPKNLLLTAALAAGINTIKKAYEIREISKSLDFANIMTYDFHGSWDKVTGANTPLFAAKNSADKTFTLDAAVKYYIDNGMPAEKINLGLALYGRTWTLASSQSNSMGSPTTGPGTAGKYTREPGFLSYYEICANLKQGWTKKWDSEQMIPYAFSGNQWVSFDDKQSLKAKVDFLKSKNLGGAMFWAVDLDDFTGTSCGQGNYPLLSYVKSELASREAPEPSEPTDEPSEPTEPTDEPSEPTEPTETPETPEPPPSTDTCPSDGFFPLKGTGCAEFYRCVNGQAFHFFCPPGTIFDTKINVCNFKDQVICSN